MKLAIILSALVATFGTVNAIDLSPATINTTGIQEELDQARDQSARNMVQFRMSHDSTERVISFNIETWIRAWQKANRGKKTRKEVVGAWIEDGKLCFHYDEFSNSE